MDETQDTARMALSALMDGEAAAGEVESACARWRDAVDARERWHAYHLIGDVLRSEELASSPERDARFLAGMRERLATEAVPLVQRSAATRPALRWQTASVAAAAGFLAVAGVLVAMRSGGDATGQPAGGAVLASASQPEVMTASGKLIRDAQLDRYFSAHRRVSNGASVMVPGAVVRSVDTMAIDEK